MLRWLSHARLVTEFFFRVPPTNDARHVGVKFSTWKFFSQQSHHTLACRHVVVKEFSEKMKVFVLTIALLAASTTAFVPVNPSRPSLGTTTELMAKKKKKKNKSGEDGITAGEWSDHLN